jgi:hypothetical protein
LLCRGRRIIRGHDDGIPGVVGNRFVEVPGSLSRGPLSVKITQRLLDLGVVCQARRCYTQCESDYKRFRFHGNHRARNQRGVNVFPNRVLIGRYVSSSFKWD